MEKKFRGFALLTPEQRRENASRAGKRAHELGRAHKFSQEEAKAAGRLGGLVTGGRKRAAAQQAPL